MKRVMKQFTPKVSNIAGVGGEPLVLPNHSGDNVKGFVSKTPVNDSDFANKKYVDDKEVESFPTSLTTGSIPFSDGSTLAQDNSKLFWDNVNKRLGIGTTTPGVQFTVDGGASEGQIMVTSNSGGNASLHLTEGQNQTVGARLQYIGGYPDRLVFSLGNGVGGWTDKERMTIERDSGNVGIGTTTPVCRLAVEGDSTVTGGIRLKSGVSDWRIYIPAVGKLRIGGSGGTYFWEANYSPSGRSPSTLFTIPYAAATAGTTTAIRAISGQTGNLLEFQNSTPAIISVFNASGHLGIGTTAPQGSLHVGDQATNYMKVASNGEIGLVGTARVKDCVWIDAASIRAPLTKSATYVAHGLNGAWSFADAVEANQETINAATKIPSNIDRSVAPSFKIAWSADGVSPGNCKWQFEYVWRALNEDTTAVAQETLTVVSTASATSNGLVVAEITGIDLPSSSDECLYFRITRLSADAQDTIADTTELLCICLEFTADKLGTAL